MNDLKISLTAARVNAGLTQKELAEKVGKSEGTIINWEKNPSNIRFHDLKKLCDVLKINIDNIFF